MNSKKDITLCIYHGNCADGFGAAWVVRKALGPDVEFHAARYDEPAPDVTGKNVIIVDFSYKYAALIALADKAASVLVIDHHKTAMADLDDVPQAEQHYEAHTQNSTGKLHVLFDMNRSGAGLTWDFFFPTQPRPPLINHIEDRDLWLFKLEGTREIMADLFSYPQDFATWDRLFADEINWIRLDGVAINRQHQKTVADLVRATKRRMLIGGHDVPVANLPFMFASDAGALMAEGELFAGSYFDTPDGRNFSLRSTDASMDVSEIAKQYGGGGHRNAAGFRVALDHALAYPATQPDAEAILQQLDNLAWVLAEGVLILKDQNPEAAEWFAEAEAALTSLPLPPPDPSTAAIAFALENATSDHDGMEFLRCWNEGDFDSIRDLWPDAPEEVFIGADPLYCKKADGQEIN
jgi:oligoribonuclease NrnB/cAMP/cGMP phosphodiesterase (DHH superfamily)